MDYQQHHLHYPNSGDLNPNSGDVSDHSKKPRIQQQPLLSAGDAPKRPRGRPPGSKNKPKPPVTVSGAGDHLAALRPHILEIPRGHDIARSLADFSRRRNVGVCVLSGTGSVAGVKLRQLPPESTVGISRRLDILGLSATFFPPSLALPAAAGGEIAVTLAGEDGRMVGGVVDGPLVAAGTVVVVMAVFDEPSFHCLPMENEEDVGVECFDDGSDEQGTGIYDGDDMWARMARGQPTEF